MKANILTSGFRFFASDQWKIITDVSIFLLFFFCVSSLKAQIPLKKYPKSSFKELFVEAVGDTAMASLLTCAPGNESYELYGHTALRIRGGSGGKDMVYNYGYFNFNRPNFVWHFILGETDYSLRAIPMSHFYGLYTSERRWIEEQELNLTCEEVERLTVALEKNCEQAIREDWTYRYNYLTDNCTTRAIEQIRQALDGTLVLPKASTTTYRAALHRYTAAHPWSQLGNDMLLGAACDDSINAEQQLFLPIDAENLLQSAQVQGKDGTLRPLVKAKKRIADIPDKPADTRWPPMVYVVLLLLLTIALTIYEKVKRKKLWAYDVLLLTMQGVAGCLIAFMLCFSKHPTVDSNLHIFWLNPLPLFFLWPVMRNLRLGRPARFFWLQTGLLAVFFVLANLQIQNIPLETLLLALCLLIRAAWHAPRLKFMNNE